MEFYLHILMNMFLWCFANLGSEIKWMLVSTPWQQLLHFIHPKWTVTCKPSLGKKIGHLKNKWLISKNDHTCLDWNLQIIFKLRMINLFSILKCSLLTLTVINYFIWHSLWMSFMLWKLMYTRKKQNLNVIFGT